MHKKKMGKTSLEISELSFGTVSLGLPYGIGVNGNSDMLAEQAAVDLLNEALDSGVIFFDTALGYGTSEKILGKAFKNRRSDAVICTKPARLYDFYSGQPFPSAAEIKSKLQSSLDKSLSSLQTDHIDIYMSHDGTEEVIENDTVVDFFQGLKKNHAQSSRPV